jgi:hypothetical protein
MLRMLTKIIQPRVALLAGVLVIAVALAVLQRQRSWHLYQASTALFVLLMLAFLVAGLGAHHARRPATFLIRDGAFAAPPDASVVLAAGAQTVLAVYSASLIHVVTHLGFGIRLGPLETVVLTLSFLLLPLAWYRALGPFGPVLRPDGLLDRQPFGSVFVPWTAGPTAESTTTGVRLRIGRPELIQRRGWRPGTLIRTGADRAFTAWAINLYAQRPDLRSAIGTEDGLLLLKPR